MLFSLGGVGISDLVWLGVYGALAVLIYLGYFIGLSANNYDGKERNHNKVMFLTVASLLAFIVAGFSWIVTGNLWTGSIALGMSVLLDIIILMFVGTGVRNEDGQLESSTNLSYVTIAPILYKFLLFWYYVYSAGSESTNYSKIYGDNLKREEGEGSQFDEINAQRY